MKMPPPAELPPAAPPTTGPGAGGRAPLALDIGSTVLALEQVGGLSALAAQAVLTHAPGPYWAYLWPSARALARFVGESDDLRGLRALDLGAGLGAVGIAAATRGAEVLCADLRPEAVALALENAARNGVQVQGLALDWSAPPAGLGRFDRIFAADVFYEDGMLAGVLRFLKAHLAQEGVAWIADPMRVAPGGVAGAARFHGLETTSLVLVEGTTMTGGVTLHRLEPRRSRLSR